MKINRDNYEAYLLDLLEGRLSAEDQQLVRDFLLLNPDCLIGMDDIEPWVLEKTNLKMPGKEQLKKEFPDDSFLLTEANFDLFSIARLEGDLTEKQQADHDSMLLQSEERKKQWESWKNTKIAPEAIIFARKNQLKRKTGIANRTMWISVIAAAATIALLITLFSIDFEFPDADLAQEINTTQTLEEPSVIDQIDQDLELFQEVDSNQELASTVPDEGNKKPEDKPAMFSIKRNTERPLESQNGKDVSNTDQQADTLIDVRVREVKPGPVRIAEHMIRLPNSISQGSYDQITALEIPPSSIHRSSLSLTQLAELDLQELFDDYTEENDISLLTIANAGLRGINRITGGDMSLLASKDEEGDVSGIRFKSRIFSLATPVERSE